MKKKIHFLLSMILLIASQSNAQILNGAILNTTGGSQDVNDFSLEWSVGESISIQSYNNQGLTLTEGLLQPICYQTLGPLYNESRQYYFTQLYPTITSGPVFLKFKMPNLGIVKIKVQNNIGQHIFYKEISTGYQNIESLTLPLVGKGAYHVFLEYNILDIPKNRVDHFTIVKQ